MGCRVWQLVFTSPLHHRHTLLIFWSFDLSQVLAHPLLGGHLGLQWHKGQEDDRPTGEAHLENKTYKINGIGHSSKYDEIDSRLNRRFLRRSRTTCWRSWSSQGAPSWSGWLWSSGGCSGLLPLSYTGHPGMKYALRLQTFSQVPQLTCIWSKWVGEADYKHAVCFKIIMQPLADSYVSL